MAFFSPTKAFTKTERVMGKIYVLNQRHEETYDAAGKAMRDLLCILADKGSSVIWSVPKHCKKVVKVLDFPYMFLFVLCRVGRRDMIFYSIPENRAKIKLLKWLKAVKKFRICCFINDLNAFRYEQAGFAVPNEERRRELELLTAADTILAPNHNTVQMLTEAGVHTKMIPVGIWDYLMDDRQIAAMEMAILQKKRDKEKLHIAFAGNLNKSEFLMKMEVPEGFKMELWGKLDDKKQQTLPEGCSYHGVLSSDEIPIAICTMDYGLVWDGVGSNAIEGGLGEYLRYNNSHKCALYLAAGVPVIVWSQSGMAHFVREHVCGVIIECLEEMAGALRTADHERLKQNAMKVAPQLRKGYYLSRALDAAGNIK